MMRQESVILRSEATKNLLPPTEKPPEQILRYAQDDKGGTQLPP